MIAYFVSWTASSLLTQCYISGYELSMDDLKSFRQSEVYPVTELALLKYEQLLGHLGQGFAQAVG